MTRLKRVSPDRVLRRGSGLDEEALRTAQSIVDDVMARGEPAVRAAAQRFDGLSPDDPLFLSREELESSLRLIPASDREVLERTAERIRSFAIAQRDCIRDLETEIGGVACGHRALPLGAAGCYAPAGRYPLPSSALMTAVTASVAGVASIWLASPRPDRYTLSAAAIAGAEGVLCAGGAQAIAAFASGCGPMTARDVVVGPGNKYVTAAKYIVSRWTRIDMLAGPSELVVVADGSARPDVTAADLLAQAEHDPEATVILLATNKSILDAVDSELARQVEELATGGIARQALERGFACQVASLEEAGELCDRLAPEHLQLSIADAAGCADLFRCYGAIFLGAGTGEVMGDYGAGPNHVLPTGGTASGRGGLSVIDFIAWRSWLADGSPDQMEPILRDAARLAELEGLPGHARAATLRLAAGRTAP